MVGNQVQPQLIVTHARLDSNGGSSKEQCGEEALGYTSSPRRGDRWEVGGVVLALIRSCAAEVRAGLDPSATFRWRRGRRDRLHRRAATDRRQRDEPSWPRRPGRRSAGCADDRAVGPDLRRCVRTLPCGSRQWLTGHELCRPPRRDPEGDGCILGEPRATAECGVLALAGLAYPPGHLVEALDHTFNGKDQRVLLSSDLGANGPVAPIRLLLFFEN